MKLNPVTTIIASGLSALIAFAFYTYLPADSKIMLTVGSFAFLLITSVTFLSLSFPQPRTTTLVKTVSSIFFLLGLVLHISAGFLKFNQQSYIISIPETARSIAAAVAQASKAAQVKVKRAYIGIGGVGLDEAFARGETVVERGDSELTGRDIPRVLGAAEHALAPTALLNRRVLHTIPLRYSVDGVRVMGRSPIGLKGVRLSVEALFITCLERHVSDIVSAVEEAGIEVEDVAASPLAASFRFFTNSDKSLSTVLLGIFPKNPRSSPMENVFSFFA